MYLEHSTQDPLLDMSNIICNDIQDANKEQRIKSLGFIHSTVNHQKNYVNPASGTNTQGIERSWLDEKIKILRKRRGTTELLLQSHLNEYCYRVMRKHSPNLLIDFLNDIPLHSSSSATYLHTCQQTLLIFNLTILDLNEYFHNHTYSQSETSTQPPRMYVPTLRTCSENPTSHLT